MEKWKDVKGYEGYYQVSNLGNIKSLRREVNSSKGTRFLKERILKPAPNERGYLTVVLAKEGKNKTYKVHQLVAIGFLNHTPSGLEVVVDHKNENKIDNRLENLQLLSNRKNLTRSVKGASSKYPGVCWDRSKNKWKASAFIDGKRFHLGNFKDEVTASEAYQTAIK